MQSFAGTYCEVSPSGTGVKLWVRGVLPGHGLKVFVDADGKPCTAQADSAGSIEMYDTGRYFAVTGAALGPLEIGNHQLEIDSLYKRLRGTRPPESPRLEHGQQVTEGARHRTLLSTAARWRIDGMGPEGILAGLRTLNLQVCVPPKSERELKGIVDWLASKPPKYRLTPKDFDNAAEYQTGGAAPNPEHKEDPPPPTSDPLDVAEAILTSIIESKEPERLMEPAFIAALAAAGQIKQHEAKRRLQLVFQPVDFPVREWQLRIKEAEAKVASDRAAFSDYILTATGEMRPHLANAITMMKSLPLVWDSFACCGTLTKQSPWGTSGTWTDYDDVKCLEWCQRQGLNLDSKRTVADAANAVARDRKPHYHPVVEYLQAQSWDGEPRLDQWLARYLGCADTPYTRAVASKWCMSAVKRVMDPNGHGSARDDLGWNQADYTLVLEGQQGKRKSSALRALCGTEWFTASIRDIGTKDSAMQLQGKWIVEIAELDAFRRAEMTTIKAWLVEREDNFRPPYGYRAENFVRQNVFAASTNKEDWLTDETGGRRFWPVKVGDIDVPALIRDRDQLWAEAHFRWANGEATFMSEPLEGVAQEEQGARQDQDPWKDAVEAWVEYPQSGTVELRSNRNRIYLPEVLEYCCGVAKKDWNHTHKLRVGRILRLAGYTTKRASLVEIDDQGRARRPEYWVREG